MARVPQNCQVKVKSLALKNQEQNELLNEVLKCKPAGLKGIVKYKEADYAYFHFDTHVNASVFYNTNRGHHSSLFGVPGVEVLPAKENGKSVVYSQQPIQFQPQPSSPHAGPSSPPQPPVQPQPPSPQASDSAASPPSPVPAARPLTSWKRPFEEGLNLLEKELQDKLEKRRRLDGEIAAIGEKIEMTRKILDHPH